MRAKVVLAHLAAAGHELKVATYDRGLAALSADHDVFEVEGLKIASRDNRVSLAHTLAQNVKRLPRGARSARALREALFEDFAPQLAICDFEPLTAHLALRERVPLVTLDNQHFVRYVEHERVPGRAREARTMLALVRAMVPRSQRSLVTSFLPGKPKNERTFLVPPILRPEILALRPTRGEHVLVYCTQPYPSLVDDLRSLRHVPFRLYGFERAGKEGNLDFRKFSQAGFLEDLAGARAVVATAGFTLLGETLQLGKPLLALPMQGQYEQELNSYLLGKTGWGRDGRGAGPETVGDFLFRLPQYEEALASHPKRDNRETFAAVDAAVRDFTP
jgi:uncharacterized protein (TIGR00661 family)